MRKRVLESVAVFMIFFIGTCCLMVLDTVCEETTGRGGNLVFDVEKVGLFN